jgi:NTP pyrophosphatase (non-canonical NTP hydrolase)
MAKPAESSSQTRKTRTMLDLSELQEAVGNWATRNFNPANGPLGVPAADRIEAMRCVLGVAEEAGELAEHIPDSNELQAHVGKLCHAILKRDQAIRGTYHEHCLEGQDAVGDILVYLMHLCHRERWSLEGIIKNVTAKVLKRDWTKDALSGGEQGAPVPLKLEDLAPSGKLTIEQSTACIEHAISLSAELEEKLIEVLASYAHDAWAGWMRYLFSLCSFLGGAATIEPDLVSRWRRQADAAYDSLPNEEKISDRGEALHMLSLIRRYATITPGIVIRNVSGGEAE